MMMDRTDRVLTAAMAGMFLLGFAGGRFAPLPAIDIGREVSLLLLLLCVAISVALGLVQTWMNKRLVTQFRALVDDLKQTSKQIRKESGASR